MGQSAFFLRESSLDGRTSDETGLSRPAHRLSETTTETALADSETRQVLGLLRRALDRLPE
ncbi:MAG TPA: hypothetical protein VL358_12870 [Caulobacteraceae bacterium]|jgi:hypothetical protein|nr:hypothetical protein [Caulobacteraceae bacterium]